MECNKKLMFLQFTAGKHFARLKGCSGSTGAEHKAAATA
jgi:hypothetical protein